MRLARPGFAALLAMGLAACPGGGGGTEDGGVGGDGGGVGDSPVQIPWLDVGEPTLAAPDLGPCPGGWREVTSDDGVTVCEPWPDGGEASCGDGEAHFPGAPGCAPLGPACPAGDLPADLPADRTVVYVLAGAAAGGDGSAARPYAALDAFAYGSLPSSTIVAVGIGTYDAVVRLPRGVGLWGACAAGTVLTTTIANPREGVVTPRGADTELRHVAIVDAERVGVLVGGAGNSIHLEGVEVRGARRMGLLVGAGGTLTGRAVAVRGTRAHIDGLFGRGVSVETGSTATLTEVVFSENLEGGAAAVGEGAELTLSDAAILRTQVRPADLTQGYGGVAAYGGRVSLSRVVVEENREAGVIIADPGSLAELDQVVLRDTRPSSAGDLGAGLAVEGGSLDASRLLAERNRMVSLGWTGGAMGTMTDVVVRDTLSREADVGVGIGIYVHEGSSVALQHATVIRALEAGVAATGSGTTLTLEDLRVQETLGRANGTGVGYGLAAQFGAEVEGERIILDRSLSAGLAIAFGGTVVRLSDLVVRHSQGFAEQLGRGVNVELEATAELTRVLVEDNQEMGVYLHGADTFGRFEDLVVRDTRSRPVDGQGGRGLNVQASAIATVTGGLFERNREVSVLSVMPESHIDLLDVLVRDSRLPDCAPADCFGPSVAVGLGAYGRGSISAGGFAVRNSAVCGAHVADSGLLSLSDGEITGCTIGACVQVPDFDLAQLTDRVAYTGNETNLEATSLPVPSALPPAIEGGP